MPDLGRQNSRAVTVRLPELLYNHLVAQATLHGTSLADALRQALDRDVDATGQLPIEGNAPGDPGLDYRSFLGMADFTQAIRELEVDAAP